MYEKSHVSLEQHACLVCGKAFETGAILMDRRLRASLARHTVTGWGLCPEHQQLSDDGFVALVECDSARSGATDANGCLKPEQCYRTGKVAHLARDVFPKIFQAAIPSDQPCVFVEQGVIDYIQARVRPDQS